MEGKEFTIETMEKKKKTKQLLILRHKKKKTNQKKQTQHNDSSFDLDLQFNNSYNEITDNNKNILDEIEEAEAEKKKNIRKNNPNAKNFKAHKNNTEKYKAQMKPQA